MQQYWKGVGRYGTLGLEIALSVLVGLFLGRWLDRRFGAHGVLTLLGFGYGVAAGARAVVRAMRLMTRDAEEEERLAREARKRYKDDDSK